MASVSEKGLGLWDNSYRFPGMKITIEEGGIDEGPGEETSLGHPIGQRCRGRAGAQRTERSIKGL